VGAGRRKEAEFWDPLTEARLRHHPRLARCVFFRARLAGNSRTAGRPNDCTATGEEEEEATSSWLASGWGRGETDACRKKKDSLPQSQPASPVGCKDALGRVGLGIPGDKGAARN
jgi:hypothetical protein